MRTKGRWAEKETGNAETPEQKYAYGVLLAIGWSTGTFTSWFGRDIDRDYDPET